MPYTIKTRFLAEASGSGEERKIAGFATLTTPTQCSGPIRQVFTTTAPVERVSVISGEMVMLYVEAIVSGLYLNPFASTPIVTCGCFISQGAFAYFPYKTTVSALPWGEAQTARCEAEIWYAAVS